MKKLKLYIRSFLPRFSKKTGLLITLVSITSFFLMLTAGIAFSFSSPVAKNKSQHNSIWNIFVPGGIASNPIAFFNPKPTVIPVTPNTVQGGSQGPTVKPTPGSSTTNTSPTPTPPAGINVTVTLNPSNTGLAIPSRFLGLSAETEMLCTMLTLDGQSSAYSQLFKNLGNETLRIGGNQSDFASWSPNGTYSCAHNNTVVTKMLVNNIETFLSKVGWNFTWSVNLGTYDPTTFSDEANYVMTSGESNLYAIAIGNEPDLYATNGLRTSSYNYASYKPEWEAYKSAILGLNSAIPLMGDDQCCSNTWFSSFLSDESSLLTLAGYHYYPTTVGGSGSTAPTASNLLSSSLMSSSLNTIGTRKSIADTNNIPFGLTETNSTSGGGQSGVSDAFASTLWGADYIFSVLEKGAKKMNFHLGSSGAAYAPIDASGNAKALYYAFLFFENVISSNGNVITPTIKETNVNTTAHAVLGTDNKLRVAVINKDLSNTAVVDIHTTRSYSQATSLTLTASSVSATSGITFGGNSVANDGTWTANTPTTLQLNGGADAYITLPAASAAVVTLQ